MNRNDNVIKIILEMFSQRFYKNILYNEEENLITADNENNQKVYAFTKPIIKFNVEEIHHYISVLQKDGINHCLLVYESMPTSAVKNIISNVPDIGINIELFQTDDLQINITKHFLVPKHFKLSKEESKKFKEQYGILIPILLKSDPICRFYNFSRGDIIKIVRKNGFITYRIVK